MARLPIPGSDVGVWGNILNDFLSVELNADGTLKASGTISTKANTSTTISAGTGLTGGGDLSTNRTISANFGATAGTIAQGNDSRITGAIQSTVVDAKGDLLVASAADTVTRLGVGNNGEMLIADSTQTAGVKWGTPAQMGSIYPMSEYGFFTATTAFDSATGNGTLSSIFVASTFVPAQHAIVGAGAIVRVAGTLGAGGENGFAIYEADGTLVTSSVSDDSLWASTGWRTKAFASTVAAQSSDRFVFAAVIVNGYTVSPNILYGVVGGGIFGTAGGGYNKPSHRRAFYTGAASWPASFDPATYGSDPAGYIPFIGLA